MSCLIKGEFIQTKGRYLKLVNTERDGSEFCE